MLSPEQLEQLQDALLQGPRHWGYKTQLWTLERITKLIAKLFDVQYHPSHVFKILRGMGWSCQRPTRQAKERTGPVVAVWDRLAAHRSRLTMAYVQEQAVGVV